MKQSLVVVADINFVRRVEITEALHDAGYREVRHAISKADVINQAKLDPPCLLIVHVRLFACITPEELEVLRVVRSVLLYGEQASLYDEFYCMEYGMLLGSIHQVARFLLNTNDLNPSCKAEGVASIARLLGNASSLEFEG